MNENTSRPMRIVIAGPACASFPADAIRLAKGTMRNVEAGPDGIEYLAFGAGDDPMEVEMAPDWWSA